MNKSVAMVLVEQPWLHRVCKKSCIRETNNLSHVVDSSTDTFLFSVAAEVAGHGKGTYGRNWSGCVGFS